MHYILREVRRRLKNMSLRFFMKPCSAACTLLSRCRAVPMLGLGLLVPRLVCGIVAYARMHDVPSGEGSGVQNADCGHGKACHGGGSAQPPGERVERERAREIEREKLGGLKARARGVKI